MLITYRHEVTPNDPAAIRQIVMSSGFFNREEIEVAVELAQEFLDKGESSGYRFIFAQFSEQVVGYTCYGRIAGTVGSFDLYWIAVLDDLRGMGIGSALLARTEDAIKSQHGRGIYIETASRSDYTSTQLFYSKMGYALVARLSDFYAPGDDKLIFVKNI